jgi:hypothetical protein
MKLNRAVLAIGIVAILSGFALRLSIDGSEIQIPASVLIFGGLGCIFFFFRGGSVRIRATLD